MMKKFKIKISGYVVVQAEDAESAMELVEDNCFDCCEIVVTDYTTDYEEI